MALGFMRRHRRWLYGFLWVVIAAFIILYIPALTGLGDRGTGAVLVEVGSLPVTVAEYQKAYLRQREYYESLYHVDAEQLKRMGLEEQTLQSLIDDRVMQLEASRLGLSVDDEDVRQHLATDPQFQVDGRFMGGDEIRRRLEMRGTSVAEFEQDLRRGLLREKLASLVTDGVMVSAREAEEEYHRRNEQVKTEYVKVPDLPGVTASDEEVKARFEGSKDHYAWPERRVVDYVLLDFARLAPRVTVTEADERAYYDGHQDDFKQDEQVCASHILVKVKATPEAADGHADDEAKKIAQAALDQVKGGADFAALAKKMSEDQGSAAKGGDLSCFVRGAMVPEFENAAFSLKPGEVSDLVKTQYGYHVIKVTSHIPDTTLPFAQAKDRIHQTLTAQRVRALVDEQVQALADALRHGKSLADASRERGLQQQQSKPLARGDNTAPLSSPALVARAFELKKGETEPEPFPVPTGGDAFIALADVQAPRPATLEEVKDRVRADILQEKTQAASLQKALELKQRAEAVGLDKAASASGYVRKETQGLVPRGQPMGDLGTSPALDEAAFALPEKALSDPIRIPGGYALVRVLERKSVDPAAFEKEKGALIASLRQARKEELFRAFLQEARKRVTVQRNADAFKRVMAS